MDRYETPPSVARELARHTPSRLSSLLEPSVGAGALLSPLNKKLLRQNTKVVCVDIDQQVLDTLAGQLEFDFEAVAADFLEWSAKGQKELFDCVIMNPPFAGRQKALRIAKLPGHLDGRLERYMPMEAAFICRSIELLKMGGRLLSVVPASVVMSESLQWLRDLLLNQGAIRSVHELPPGTFSRVESRMYLLVYDKGASQRKIRFFNHDLNEPHRLDLKLSSQSKVGRLDYRYHSALQRMNKLMSDSRFEWRTLESLAIVLRGDIRSPFRSDNVIHTTSFSDGYWHLPQTSRHAKNHSVVACVREGDILIKRVGRGAAQSVGRCVSATSAHCSDCVFIIRPKEGVDSRQLLFSLKVVCAIPYIKALLERGTGASYISKASLLKLNIPTNLHRFYRSRFRSFRNADLQNSRNSELVAQRTAHDLVELVLPPRVHSRL